MGIVLFVVLVGLGWVDLFLIVILCLVVIMIFDDGWLFMFVFVCGCLRF